MRHVHVRLSSAGWSQAWRPSARLLRLSARIPVVRGQRLAAYVQLEERDIDAMVVAGEERRGESTPTEVRAPRRHREPGRRAIPRRRRARRANQHSEAGSPLSREPAR